MQDTKLLQIRGVPSRYATQFASGAKARGMTQAQYLIALIELRRKMNELFGEILEDDYDAHDIATQLWGAMHDLDLYTHGV